MNANELLKVKANVTSTVCACLWFLCAPNGLYFFKLDLCSSPYFLLQLMFSMRQPSKIILAFFTRSETRGGCIRASATSSSDLTLKCFARRSCCVEMATIARTKEMSIARSVVGEKKTDFSFGKSRLWARQPSRIFHHSLLQMKRRRPRSFLRERDDAKPPASARPLTSEAAY